MNAPQGATGTYILDDVRVLGAATGDFQLAASPTAVALNQAGTATSTVTISRLNSFTAGVAFTASGLPAGVTASFAPSTATGTSSVTFTRGKPHLG